MNRERLDIQIDVLRQVAESDRAFDMSAWVTPALSNEPCKTACCAFGYAALDPRLRAQGLSLEVSLFARVGGPCVVRAITSLAEYNQLRVTHRFGRIEPTYRGETEFEAAEMFYDITRRAARYLFDPEQYPHGRVEPDDVIDRIYAVASLDGDAPSDALAALDDDHDVDQYDDLED